VAQLRRSPSGRSDLWFGSVAACAALAFALLATRDLSLPGFYYDELFEVVPSLAFVEAGLTSTVSDIDKSIVSIFGHPLALMAQPYNGGLKTIAFIPVAALFGVSPDSVRWFTVITAVIALAVYYLFTRQLFRSPAVAAVTACLLALDPAYIFFSRVDYGPSTLMFLLKGVALWQLTVWWRSRHLRHLALGCFALGLGVYDKTNFLWIVGALVVAAVAVCPRGVLVRLSRRSVALALGAFAAGALPLIIYNLSWPPRTLAPIRAGTVHLRYGNYEGNFLEQLIQRARELANLLDGHTATVFFGYERYLVVPLLPILFGCAVIGVLILFARHSTRAGARPAAFVVIMALVILLEAALTPGGDKPHHLLLVYPLPHIVVAATAVGAVQFIWRRVSARRALAFGLAVGAALAVQPALGAVQSRHVLHRLHVTGGADNFSDGIYRLEEHLTRREASRKIVMLDWGIFYPVVALSDGKLRCRQLWRELNSDGPIGRSVVEEVTDPAASYVVHVPAATNFVLPRKRFFAEVRNAGLIPRRQALIRTRRGDPLFAVYRLFRPMR
jgi:Dolichyl-phosphate-mannose-protein mannosyltransferase